MKYSLHPEAESDLREAATFYRDNAGNVFAQSFLSEVERSMQLLLQHPSLGAAWRCGKRRHVMKHFPYSLIYSVHEEEIRIFAVAHQSRHPTYWRQRK